MKRIQCYINQHEYDMNIQNYKILYGNRYDDVYEAFKCIRSYFNKTTLSEYSKENSNYCNLKLNDENVDIKNTLFFEINSNYDFSLDAKMNSKSIILKFYETCLENIEYDEGFTTLKELLISLINIDLEETLSISLNDEKEIHMIAQNDDFNFKSLIKLIIPTIIQSGMELNNIDLSYETIILLQLEMIKRIASKSTKEIIILSELPLITSKIYNKLEEMPENISMIIYNNSYYYEIPIENMVLLDFNWLDLANENDIYEYLFHLAFTYNISQFKTVVKETLENCYIQKQIFKK